MYEINESKYFMTSFQNINEFVNYLKKPKKDGRSNSSQNPMESGFNVTMNLEEAIEKLKTGDDNLYERVIKEKKKINTDKLLGNVKKRKTYKKDIVGFQPNVGAFLTGNPLNMINEEKTNTSIRILNIFINVRVNSFTGSDKVLKNGTIYATMVDLLEKAGYRTNLYVGTANNVHSSFNPDKMILLVRIKTDREPLNLKKMVFPLANADFLRRLKFRWMEVCESNIDATHDGYGQYMEIEEVKNRIQEILGEDCLVFNYEDTNGEVSETYVKELLKEKNIVIEEE